MLIIEKLFFFGLGVLIGFVMAIIVACLEISSEEEKLDNVDIGESMDHDYKV